MLSFFVCFGFSLFMQLCLSGCQGAKTELFACHLVQRLLLLFPFFPRRDVPWHASDSLFSHSLFFSKVPNTERVSPGFYLSPRLSSGGRTWAGSYRHPAEGGTRRVLSAAAAACYIDESRYSESPLPTSPPVSQMDLRLLRLLRAHFCGFSTARRTNGTTSSMVLLFVSGIEPDRAVVTLPLDSRLKLKCLIAC